MAFFGFEPDFYCFETTILETWKIKYQVGFETHLLLLRNKFKTLGFTAESCTKPKNKNQQLLKNKLQTRKQSQFHEVTRNFFLGLKPIWNSKAETPMSVIKSNQDIKFNLNIQERKAYTVLNRFCHVMCQSRPDTIPLYLVARCLPGARQGQTHFDSALKFLYH